MINDNPLHTEFTHSLINLAAERTGGEALACSDDFFAPMENLVKPGRGVFIADKYTDRGKWMDGWESRRSFGRDNGREYDWCILRLGISGVIEGIDVDTHHFRGNAPQAVALEACVCEGPLNDQVEWIEILTQSPVEPHSQNLFRISSPHAWTHVRLTIFPDGGVARLRVYGNPHIDWRTFLPGELIDLAAIKNGGRALSCSDMFFSDKNNLLMPGRGVNMGDGWETKRRRENALPPLNSLPQLNHDWVIVKLGSAGSINKVLIDTHHFKGNFPDRFSLEGSMNQDGDWQTIIPETKLMAHREHLFIEEIMTPPTQTFTHVRLNIFPDGGISRMRLFGYCREDGE